ncbi:MAG TPA: hypothetical protein VL156_08780 [Terriglobales bacterium]|jgi:hypothetical protein|nr:hypothetical protein [Terriglobales bacterium]
MRYRRVWIAVVCVLLVSTAFAQVAKRRPVSQGPRALGLVEIDSNGSGRLVPVLIMVDGKFYDASIYKADPVPMALQPGTVYEAVKSGVPQGLFTVTNPLPQKGWLGLGSWRTNAQIAAEKEKAETRATKLAEKHDDDIKAGGPPRLSRTPEGAHPKAAETAPPTSGESGPPKATEDDSDRPVLKKPAPAPKPAAGDSSVENSDRPMLRRQNPGEAQQQTKSTPDTPAAGAKVDAIPAVSDADGPQPRPYTFQTKPNEEQDFMKKMAAMAADEVKRRLELLSPGEPKAKGVRSSPAPEFRDQQLKILDISGTNEAVLIYSATATVAGRADLQFSTAVVARQDIYGDLHKIFAHTTDNNHLDMQPRYEFIDAVDADGDGRGELLFKQVGDSGTGYGLYRVIGDRLWPLFESKPGG